MVTDPREKAWRAEFPITERLNYLNNCSLTPLHRRGRDRIERFLTEWTEQGGRAWYDHWIGEYEAFREELAGLLGAAVDEIGIEPNVSAGVRGNAGPCGVPQTPQGDRARPRFSHHGHPLLPVRHCGAPGHIRR